ncbi:MAG: methyltransferase [Pseudomonadota bacterium]
MFRLFTRALCATAAGLLLVACQQDREPTVAATAAEDMPSQSSDPALPASETVLAAVLSEQPEEVIARFKYRHPQETLEFFGIKPGMTVIEALPGGGWYSKILLQYLGSDGRLIGSDYDPELFPLFGFFSDEDLKAKETWVSDWTEQAQAWFPDQGVAAVSGMQFGSLPSDLTAQVDAVLLIRALHNLARFEDEGGFLTAAVADISAALKPGGVVGIVQHMAPEDAPDDWASGSAGYLKKSFVKALFEDAGFEMVGESSINENPKDTPTTDDIVWRLPPTLASAREDTPEAEAVAAAMTEIGESTRMTLLFRKPV